jgi:hypothetical protein
MTNEQKKQVRDALVRYVNNYASQAQAAASLDGISSSTISQMKNDNWELLSERLWHHIARQVGFYTGEWQPGDTNAYLLLRILLSDAQHYAMTYGIAIKSGLGKTFTAGHYLRENSNTIYLSCNEQYNRRSFITALASTAGVVPTVKTVPELIQQFTTFIDDQSQPLIILDDAEKLKDRVLHLVVILANSIAGKAGIVILGGEQLRNRIIDGVRLKKVGYEEIFKSIGKRFITLNSLSPRDVEQVCVANGVDDEDVINFIREHCGDNLHTAAALIRQQLEMSHAA